MAMQPYREAILEECLTILGNTDTTKKSSIEFWNRLHEKLQIAFPEFPTAEELLKERQDLNDLAGICSQYTHTFLPFFLFFSCSLLLFSSMC
jgi:hypothetical protein